MTLEKKNEIIKVLFWLEVIFLVITIFYFSKVVTISIIVSSIILSGSYLILDKYSDVFETLSTTNKLVKNLSGRLSNIN